MACEEQKVRHQKKSGAVIFCSLRVVTSSVIYDSTENKLKNRILL